MGSSQSEPYFSGTTNQKSKEQFIEEAATHLKFVLQSKQGSKIESKSQRLLNMIIDDFSISERDNNSSILNENINIWVIRLILSKKFQKLITGPETKKSEYKEFLVAMFTKKLYKDKTTQLLHKYPITDQGNEGICWAHANSTGIYLTLSRIMGRKVPPFSDILNDLLQRFGRGGNCAENVLSAVQSKYKIHFNRVSECEIPLIIKKLRVCVASFHLNNNQWENFSRFFTSEQTKDKAITLKDLNKPLSHQMTDTQIKKGKSGYEGHEVVLIEVKDDVYTFINSWGIEWGDNGCFRVKKGAIKFNFFDIYWYESDLSWKEKKLWETRSEGAANSFIALTNSLPERLKRKKQEMRDQHRSQINESYKKILVRALSEKEYADDIDDNMANIDAAIQLYEDVYHDFYSIVNWFWSGAED